MGELRVEGLCKRFGGFTALDGVTLPFSANRLTSIIGPNGAGKSTLFNLLSGAFAPTAGRIHFEGKDITGLAQHRFQLVGPVADDRDPGRLQAELERAGSQVRTVQIRALSADQLAAGDDDRSARPRGIRSRARSQTALARCPARQGRCLVR